MYLHTYTINLEKYAYKYKLIMPYVKTNTSCNTMPKQSEIYSSEKRKKEKSEYYWVVGIVASLGLLSEQFD